MPKALFLLSALLFALGPAQALAAPPSASDTVSPQCQVLFQSLDESAHSATPLLARSTEGTSLERKEVLDTAKKTLDKKEYSKFEDYYYSHFFFSRDELIQNHPAGAPVANAPTLFNQNGQHPFDGYLAARKYAFSRPSESLGLQDAAEIQRLSLSRKSLRPQNWRKPWELLSKPAPTNAGGAVDADLGAFRMGRVFDHGGGSSGAALAETVVKAGGGIDDAVAVNPLLAKVTLDGGETAMEYTPLSKWRLFAGSLKPDTRRLLEGLEKSGASLDAQTGRVDAARQQAVKDLLQSAYDKVHAALAAAKTKNERIDAVADFYRRFLTIHPFNDGNGRTARIQVERLLESSGLPPPVWTVFGQDVAVSPDSLRKILHDSVNLSQQYHRDLKAVLANGFDYRLTPTVYLSPDVITRAPAGASRIVPENFMAWLANEQAKPTPPASLDDALAKYLQWQKDFTYYQESNQGIRLASPTFLCTFGKLSASEADYKLKLDAFYGSEKVYRGVKLQDPISDEEIVRQFARISDNTAGMGVSPDVKSARAAIETFNQQFLNDVPALSKKVHAHTLGSGWDYGMSGFSSFSGERSKAELFGTYYHPETNNQRTFIMEALRRKVATIDTSLPAPKFYGKGFVAEKELLITGAVDPESVLKISVLEGQADAVDPESVLKISMLEGQPGYNRQVLLREAVRTSFDSVRLTERDGISKKVLSTTHWKIRPDGSVVQVSP